MQTAYKQKLVNKVYRNVRLSKECLCVHVARWEGLSCFLPLQYCGTWVQDLVLFKLPLDSEPLMASSTNKRGRLWLGLVLTHVHQFQLIHTGKSLVTDGTSVPVECDTVWEWAFYIVILRESSKNIKVFRNYQTQSFIVLIPLSLLQVLNILGWI